MNLNKLLSISPYLEIAVRNLYYRSRILNTVLAFIDSKKPKKKSIKQLIRSPDIFTDVLGALKTFGIAEGDILIVHSSELKTTGLSPQEICNALVNLVGSEGTLAMAAIPLFKGAPKGFDRLKNDYYKKTIDYHVKKTPPWTGFLPLTLMRMPGSIRSKNPLNTMVALGKHAEEMMQNNLEGSPLKGCGSESPWKFCLDRNAKMIFLDVEPAHSMTMIHVAEDSLRENGNARGWYRDRPFRVIDAHEEHQIIAQERHPKWAMYFAETVLQKDLIKAGILQVKQVGNIKVSYCESAAVVDFIMNHKVSTYPYWIPFWMHHK